MASLLNRLVIVLVASASLCWGVIANAQSNNDQPHRSEAAALVRHALEAEARGDSSQRNRYLEEACSVDPEYPPAHWHQGQVRFRDEWVKVDEATVQAAEHLPRYRQLFTGAVSSAPSHIRMAHWCCDRGLQDLENYHLRKANQLNPKLPEPVRKLDLVRFQGRYWPRAEARAQLEHTLQAAAATSHWRPKLKQLEADLRSQDSKHRESALAQLQSVNDPLAIPTIESIFAKAADEVGRAVVVSLANMGQQPATDSLVRFSVLSDHETVRRSAAEALQSRSLYSYVPTMMAGLREPADVQFETFYSEGMPAHRLTIFQEGPFAKHETVSAGNVSIRETFSRKRDQIVSSEIVPDVNYHLDLQTARHALAANEAAKVTNPRIVQALQVATGQNVPAAPAQAWNWWMDHNGIYRPPVKYLAQNYTSTLRPRYHLSYVSCFAAGTKVSALQGELPIEQVQTGDWVLAQDPISGELAFKPVLATTVRPASPVIELRAGTARIHVTPGHPFWVSGLGWQMAKELTPGQRLHTITGPLTIDVVQPGPEEVCYNLVVEGFNTYFVGDERILVHDNLIRQVTSVTVPGLTD